MASINPSERTGVCADIEYSSDFCTGERNVGLIAGNMVSLFLHLFRYERNPGIPASMQSWKCGKCDQSSSAVAVTSERGCDEAPAAIDFFALAQSIDLEAENAAQAHEWRRVVIRFRDLVPVPILEPKLAPG